MKRAQASSLCQEADGRLLSWQPAAWHTRLPARLRSHVCVCVSARLLSGGFSDSDLFDVGKDDTYKPDKGKGNAAPVWQSQIVIDYSTDTHVSVACDCVSTGGRPGDSDQINQYDDGGGGLILSVVFVH